MKRHIALTLLLSFGMIALGRTQTLINVAPGANIGASSVYYGMLTEFGTQKLVDGIFGPDSSGNDYNQWLANGVADPDRDNQGFFPTLLIFDLQASYSLSGVSLFNTKNAPYNDTGSKDFSIEVSSDGTNYSSSLISGTLTWQNTSFQDYQFTNLTSARYVRIQLNSAVSESPTSRVGLQEVKIMAVPEPSVLSLLAVGLGVVLRRRRRAV